MNYRNNNLRGAFLRDSAIEAWRPDPVPHSSAWQRGDMNTHHREYARWSDWVRRVLEECCWWELNGGGKNINSHLQLRLTNLYLESLTYRVVVDRISLPKMVEQEGVQPRERTWDEWYQKRSRDSDLWYKHWTSHLLAVSGSGDMSNLRTMRVREIWQLLKNGRS